MQEWEYRCLVLAHNRTQQVMIGGQTVQREYSIELVLNVLGHDGWEAVGFSPKTCEIVTVLLKRPKPPSGGVREASHAERSSPQEGVGS